MDVISLLLGLLAGFLIGGFLLFTLQRKKTQASHLELNSLREKLIHIEAIREAENKSWKEKLEYLAQNKESMNGQFRQLADKILEEKGKQFSDINKEKLSRILDPFQLQLNQFRQQVEKTHTFRIQDSAQLKTQIEQLAKLNQRIGQDALNLTNALKGQSSTQGIWGEMILERVLEQSGLVSGEHYDLQVSMENDDRRRLRPDAVVHLPGGKDIVIDSKVSLNGYEEYCSSDSEAMREEAGKAHVRSIRQHIKELVDKDYSGLPDLNTIDLVLMFVPIEGAFSLALMEDKQIFSDAFDKRIIIVSPTTLFATLRTVENSWKNEAQSKNAREIARKAGLLYDKFFGFMTDLDKVERAMGQADKAFRDAKNKLVDGQGNLVRKVEELKEMGARTNKALPENLLQQED